jgi:hypothetical protein
MPNSDLLPPLLFKINENQLALEAANMELRTGSSSGEPQLSQLSPKTCAAP